MKFSTAFLSGLLTVAALVSPAASRVGPVSQYGQLQAGTNDDGLGRIFGSCSAYNSTPVQVKGMSLFWSIDKTAAQFWTKTTIDGLVQKHGIQLIRAAMGVDEDWGAGNYFSSTTTTYYAGLMDEVVQAAIDNDIYVIIDYHSHKANYDVASAKSFFSRMAEKWGGYDNVIFEIFNEPYCQRDASDNCIKSGGNDVMITWSQVKTYANQVISTIRQYSDNLVIVGTPSWDQHPEDAINNEVTDSKHNTAYALHYYASSHGTWLQSNGTKAINAGLPLFVSEWGTIYASGRGEVGTANGSWQTWMNNNYLSSANWSVANKYEGKIEDDGTDVGGDGQGGSYFADGFVPASATGTWSYSTSGKWINSNYLVWKNGTKTESLSTKTYTACAGGSVVPTNSSSSVQPSSSASTPIVVDGDDVLLGKGIFGNCSSLTGCGWTTNIKRYTGYTAAYAGSIGLEKNNDYDVVLNFWSNGVVDEAWDLQVKHSITLTKGYAYQIVGGGYTFDDSYGKVAIGVVDGNDNFYFGIDESIDGEFSSEVYEHCSATDATAKFYINGGLIQGDTYISGTGTYGGGFAIQNVKVIATPINCGGSTTSSSSGGSVTPAGNDYIDNVEDGDGTTFTGGFWFAYDDNGSCYGYDCSESSFTNETLIDDEGNSYYNVIFPATNGSEYAAGLKGINLYAGDYPYDPYVILALALKQDESAYNLSACDTVIYDYVGADHLFKWVMYDDYDGYYSDYDYHNYSVSHSSTWKTQKIAVSRLTQDGFGSKTTLNKSKIGRFVWDVRDDYYADYLYVDNVRCKGATIVNVEASTKSSSSTATNKSSSSTAKSSSSVKPSSSASDDTVSSSSAKSSSSTAKSSSSVKSSSSTAKSSSSVKSSTSRDDEGDDGKDEIKEPAEEAVIAEKWTSTNATISSKSSSKVIIKEATSTKNRKASITAELEEGSKYYVEFNVVTAESDEGALRIQINDEDGTLVTKEYEISTESQFVSIPFKATTSNITVVATIAGTDDNVAITDFVIGTTQVIAQANKINRLGTMFSNNVLQVRSATQAPVKVQVFDIMGNSMKSVRLASGTGSVSMESMPRGQYVVKIMGKGSAKTLKVSVR